MRNNYEGGVRQDLHDKKTIYPSTFARGILIAAGVIASGVRQ